MNINDFKGNLRGQPLASPSRFRVMFSGGVLKHGPARAITYMCNQAQLPGKSFGTNSQGIPSPVHWLEQRKIWIPFLQKKFKLFSCSMFRRLLLCLGGYSYVRMLLLCLGCYSYV